MYKYLLFDLDDTLFDFKAAEAMGIRKTFELFGIDCSEKTIELYSAINDSFWKRFEKGEISRSDIYEGRFIEFSKKLGYKFDTKAVSERYFEELANYGIVFDYAPTLLELLTGKQYVLAAVTNGSLAAQNGRIAASGIAKYFNGGIYISEKIGYQKPQKEYFEHVYNAIGNPAPQEILLLGDSLSGDIAGAQKMGWDCCFVNLRNQALPDSIHPTYTVTDLKDIISVCGL